MLKKRIAAAALLVAVLFCMLPPADARAAGGLFGESWFVDPEDLYHKGDGFSSISTDGYVREMRGSLDGCAAYLQQVDSAYAFERFMYLSHMGYMVSKQKRVNQGYLVNSTVGGLVDSDCEDFGWEINNDLLDADRLDGEIINYGDGILPLCCSYYDLYCMAFRLSEAVKAYNNAGASQKTRKFKEMQQLGSQMAGEMESAYSNFKLDLNRAVGELSNPAAQTELKRLRSGIEKAKKNGTDFRDAYGNLIIEDGKAAKPNFLYMFYFYIFEHFDFCKTGSEDVMTGSGYKTRTVYKNEWEWTPELEGLEWENAAEAMVAYVNAVNAEASEIYRLNVGIIENINLDTEPGLVEKELSSLLVSVGESISSLLSENQLVIEHIIYGRVNSRAHSSGRNVNNFSFELVDGNVYGVTGAFMYSILRKALFLGLLLVFMYYLAKDAMQASARARSKLKENLGYVFLAVALIFAMPNLIDLLLKLRDVVLKIVGDSLVSGGAADINGMEKQFKTIAMSSERFVDSAQYLGIVFIALYLGFVYVGMACAFTILFAGFPIFLLVSFRDHKILNEWFSNILGIVITPIIDAILFLIPAIAATVGGSTMPSFVKLVLCMSIIPARSSIKRILGFSSSMGSELLGIGAMMAAGRAIGNVARTVRNTTGRVAEGVRGTVDDVRNSRMNGELADLGTDAAGRPEDAAGKAQDIRDAFPADASNGASPMSDSLGSLDETAGAAGGSHGFGMSGFSAGSADPAVAKILSSNAAVGNFENIKGLDPATKAELYRKRAYQRGARTVLGALGGIGGGLAGGAVGFGATTFMGPAGMAMGASSGMAIGNGLGSAAGDALSVPAGAAARGGVAAARGAAYAVRNARNGQDGLARMMSGFDYDQLYQAEDMSPDESMDPGEVTIANLFGDGVTRGQVLDYASMSPEAAKEYGYIKFIDDRFSGIQNEQQAFDVMREVGVFAGSMIDDDPGYGYSIGYLPKESRSAIVNRIQDNVSRLAEEAGKEGKAKDFANFRAAMDGVTYIDPKGRAHTGSEGYYGIGFDRYRYGVAADGSGSTGVNDNLGEPTPSETVPNSSGLNLNRGGEPVPDRTELARKMAEERKKQRQG